MQLLALLPLLATIADARHIPLRRYRQDSPNKQHHQHARAMDVVLDERGLPITATTTVVVDMTSTQTIWVQPTGQVPLLPEPTITTSVTEASTSDSPSSSVSGSISASPSSMQSSLGSEALASSPSMPASVSVSASQSQSQASSELTTPSPSVSEWVSSAVASSFASSDWASSAVSSQAASSASATDAPSSYQASETASASHSSISEDAYSSTYPASEASSSMDASGSATSTPASSTWSGSASDASSSFSSSDSLTEASTPSPSISTASASESSIRSTRTSESVVPSSSFSLNATASTSTSASASANASANASISASVSDWEASSSSFATSSSWSASIAPSASSSSSYSDTSASASMSASASWSDAMSSSSSILPSSTSASASSASPSPSSGTHLPGVPRTLMAGYYPDWSAWTLPPESVDWNRFDVVDFAFAIPTWDGRLEFTQWDSSDLLNRLVARAHANGKRVKLSIGGWTGSKYFSSLVGDSNQRQNFVTNCVKAYWAYNLDGFDIDWEYPNAGGAQGNIISSGDSANFLLFLQELREALPEDALITLATQVWPFAGSNGRPLTDVSGFASVIDWILVMNYDIWGSSDNPGPNAPLSDACGTSTQPLANAYAAVASWTSAGMPANKITLGVPAYGYLQKSWATSLRTRDYIPPSADEVANLTSQLAPLEKRQSGIVTVRNGGGGDSNGQIGFADLVKQGALALDSQGKFIGAGGFYREWDHCSSTPWIRSSSTGQVVTYDDPDSLSMKAQFARQSGLRGVNMFSMDGDWNGSGWPLTDALRSGMGI